MKIHLFFLTLALGASTSLLSAQGNIQPIEKQPLPGREGGPGGFVLLPPQAQDQLKLTADQKKQIVHLQSQIQTQLEYILTPVQRQQLKKMPPPQPGGPGGPGGPGEAGGPLGGPGAMGGQRPPMPIIEALDLNRDGIISAAEMAKAGESLKKLDKNRDGKLSSDEFLPQRPAGRGLPEAPVGEPRR